MPGDRVIVIASPASARAWSALIAQGRAGGRRHRHLRCRADGRDDRHACCTSATSASGSSTRSAERARDVAKALPQIPVFHASAFDPEFLEHERIGRWSAAVFCMNDDARNLYGAVLAKRRGVRLTIALTHDPVSAEVYESGGVDVAINPRQVVAEEMVRFAHDPRCRQVAMLDDDRFEVLDVTVRAESELAEQGVQGPPGDRLGDRRGRPRRHRALPARHRRPAARRPRDHLRRIAPGRDRRSRRS